MEYEKNVCPVLNVDGVLATGRQFDLDITLPEDNRTVIYGIVKDCYQEPVCNAVVKLVEVVCECGKEERRPVSHTFTDKDGEFVFGPLCANRFYEIEIWVDQVKHCKVCTKAERDGKCLKGIKLDCKKEDCKPCYPEKCDKHCDGKCDKHFDDKCDKDCKDEDFKHCDDKCDKDYKNEDYKHCNDKCDKDYKNEDYKHCNDKCDKDCKDEDFKHCDDKCDKDCKDECEKHCKEECKKCCNNKHEDDKECDKKEDKCDRRPCRPFGRMY